MEHSCKIEFLIINSVIDYFLGGLRGVGPGPLGLSQGVEFGLVVLSQV